MSAPKRVEFRAIDGVTLRGDLFMPASSGKLPIVVMTQGLTLLKEHYIADWAKRFNAAGYAALIYDHRGWGSSDGEPRNTVNPMQQADDYHDAVIFAGNLPGIDKNRIAIWGIGHSGGASMIAAGDDPNIKAAILVMPFFSGAYDEKNFPDGMMDRVWAERARRDLDPSARPEYVTVWDNSEEEANAPERGQTLLHAPAAFKFISGAKALSDAAGTPWENKLLLQSFYSIAKVEPQDHIYKIAPCAVLYLAAEEDEISGPLEMQKATFARAREPKQFVQLKDLHIENYKDHLFDTNAAAQIEFLKKYV
ncbi:alpha/beta-hydrolase [Rhizodiscina lignyota]|uniref:Alpha/beta-hydrolase n=1 Tax=Rhizodiscina lignyota TaxID=1504668 RepID=A0A9P4M6K2_9PEZI|nr:alpha/beta-hydrolase [Rhizodiscina lignyota]